MCSSQVHVPVGHKMKELVGPRKNRGDDEAGLKESIRLVRRPPDGRDPLYPNRCDRFDPAGAALKKVCVGHGNSSKNGLLHRIYRFDPMSKALVMSASGGG